MEVRKRISINAISTFIQICISTVVVFFLYPFLLRQLGVERFGLWTLLLVIPTFSNLAQFGLTDTLVKFVAQYNAKNNIQRIEKLLHSSIWIILFILSLTCLIIIMARFQIIQLLGITQEYISEAIVLINYLIIFIFLNMIGGFYHSIIKGLQRIDISNIIISLGMLIYMLLAFLLTPKYGLQGLVLSQVLQAAWFFLMTLCWLKARYKKLRLFPSKWSFSEVKEVKAYALNIQFAGISGMFAEPVTKILLGRLVSLESVAFFDLANRIVMQIRSILVGMMSVIVPTISELNERSRSQVVNIFKRLFNYSFTSSAIIMGSLIATSPIVISLWLHRSDNQLIYALIWLAFAHFISIIASPAYFVFKGIGILRYNTICHFSIAISNLVLGLLFGLLFGYYGIVLAWSASVCLANLYLIWSYCRISRILLRDIISFIEIKIISITAVNCFACIFFYYYLAPYNRTLINALVVIFLTLIVNGVILLIFNKKITFDFGRELLDFVGLIKSNYS